MKSLEGFVVLDVLGPPGSSLHGQEVVEACRLVASMSGCYDERMQRPKVDEAWSGMTFDGARQNTLVAGSRLSLPEKIAWLEQAHRTAIQLGALPDPNQSSQAR